MAGQAAINDQPFVADVALKRYTAVVQAATAHHVTYGAQPNADKFIGIVQEDKDAGLTANVRVEGLSYAVAAGAINVGDSLIIGDASGSVASVGSTTNPNIIGRAIEPAAAAGDLILIKITVQ